MEQRKPPTAQGISAVLRKAALEKHDGKSYSEGYTTRKHPLDAGVVLVSWQAAISRREVRDQMLGRCGDVIRAAGWSAERYSFDGAPDVFYLAVTAPESDAGKTDLNRREMLDAMGFGPDEIEVTTGMRVSAPLGTAVTPNMAQTMLAALADARESLGKIVRDTWVAAVLELIPDPKPSWTEPWETLTDEFQREVDKRIGEALAAHFAAHRPEPADGRRCATCGRTQCQEDWDLAAHARVLEWQRDALLALAKDMRSRFTNTTNVAEAYVARRVAKRWDALLDSRN